MWSINVPVFGPHASHKQIGRVGAILHCTFLSCIRILDIQCIVSFLQSSSEPTVGLVCFACTRDLRHPDVVLFHSITLPICDRSHDADRDTYVE